MEKNFRVFVYLNFIFWEKYLLLIIKSLTSLCKGNAIIQLRLFSHCIADN